MKSPNTSIGFNFLPLRTALCGSAAVTLVLGMTFDVNANPHGMTVVSGSASATQNGSQLNITTSQSAFLNWQSFNIGAGETTTFHQPNAASIVWNHVNDPNPSQIFGHLNANGVVVLINSSGFYFGPDSVVKAAGFVATTATPMSDPGDGGTWEFNGPPPTASIVNYGQISTGSGGQLFLIAEKVENHGVLTAPDGTLGLYAGKEVMLSDRPDGRGLNVSVNLPEGSVDNFGKLVADEGTIWMHAQTVNQDGVIQANSIQNKNGVIELVASDSVNLGANSLITANGDDSTPSAGGQVTIKSGNTFSDAVGSKISVVGGAQGGNGGTVELSAVSMPAIHTVVDGHAASGSVGGHLLLDPDYITLDGSGSDGAGTGTIGVNDSPGSSLDINVNSAFVGFSQIDLQAKYDITVNTLWNLAASTGISSPGSLLKLEAGNDIIVNDAAGIVGGSGWSVTLQAGRDFSATDKVTPGTGNITFNGSGSLQTQDGAINLLAGNDITVNGGYVITMGGGSITAHALAGNIDTGSDAQGYAASSSTSLNYPYSLADGLGGISTGAGGNVSLTAGGNVTSVLPIGTGTSSINYIYDGSQLSSIPSGKSDFSTAGSGAYGTQAGNVSIVAGGNVTGHYLVANGVGTITAGVQMDADGNPVTDGSGHYVLGTTGNAGTDSLKNALALSLISGGWNVNAAQDIYLQEVRNPNGVFDLSGSFSHTFDYAPGDYVNLSAGNLITLGTAPSDYPRNDKKLTIPVIYPSILNIVSGAGGVKLEVGSDPYNQLILFPSPLGSLSIITTDGGPLTSDTVGQIFSLIVSDSGLKQFSKAGNFGLSDHASTPVHLGNETPITLSISGDMNLVSLVVPEAAQVTVGGDMVNCAFQGMNLSANDVTSINVAGDIKDRSAFTSIDLSKISGAEAPILSYLAYAQNNSLGLSAATLSTSFFYDPTTQTLTYENISSTSPQVTLANILKLLQNLEVQVVINGVPQWNDPGFDTDPKTTFVSVMNSTTASALLSEYNTLGGAPPKNISTLGYFVGGGGKFNMSANNIDLGTTAGVQSKGAGLYRVGSSFPLANLFNTGPDININTVGDLDMYSTSISSLNGGNIFIDAGGNVNVGSADFTVNALGGRGIYSTSLGNVSVFANGDINVNGSRIAAYDGGNVTAESFNGNVNAGSGGTGYVILTAYYVNPVTHQVYIDSPTIPGSGILTTTFPKRTPDYPAPPVTVGNLLVEAPNGDVNASKGGIVQLPLNGVNDPNAIVEVLAGYELRDINGVAVDAADIADGTPTQVSDKRDLNANGSGVIGNTVKLDATGDIVGVVFARDNLDISAIQNVTVTALAQGIANVSAGESVSGSIIGVGGVSASGGSGVDASLLSNNSISGATSGQSGLAQGTTANSTSAAASANDDTPKAAVATTDDSDDDKKKDKKEAVAINKAGRVTLILPKKT